MVLKRIAERQFFYFPGAATFTANTNRRLAMLHAMGARVDAIGDSTEPLAI